MGKNKSKESSLRKNKGYLLDTQVFIWFMRRSGNIKSLESLLANPYYKVYLSVVSVWELVVKKGIGKLELPKTWKKDIINAGFEILNFNLEHVYPLEKLPLHHKDPFDRLLISQAKTENLMLITSDKKIWKYKVDVLKC